MLTETAIRSAKPRERPYKLFDERGLYLLVAPTGGRLWRFRYRHGEKRKLLALGAYPDVLLRRAREKRDEARRLVADGIDPNVQRQADRATLCHTFEIVAREWLQLLKNGIKAGTLERERSQLERFVFPEPVGSIVAADARSENHFKSPKRRGRAAFLSNRHRKGSPSTPRAGV